MADYWTVSENRKRVGLLEKYDMVRILNDKAPYLKGADPYQSMKLLVDLRNWQVHYYPKSVSEAIPHGLEKKLIGRFSDNALMASTTSGPWFPDKAIGAGCAEWSIATARNFCDDFVQLFSFEPNYRLVSHPRSWPPIC